MSGVLSLAIEIGLVVAFLVPAILMWVWNLTMPDVFRLPRITYWQAFRLTVLAGILFGALHLTL